MFPFIIRQSGKLQIHPLKRCCVKFIFPCVCVGTHACWHRFRVSNNRYAVGTDESMDTNSSGGWAS